MSVMNEDETWLPTQATRLPAGAMSPDERPRFRVQEFDGSGFKRFRFRVRFRDSGSGKVNVLAPPLN